MSDIFVGENGSPEPIRPLHMINPILRALNVHGAHENIDECRIELLEQLIFKRVPFQNKPFTSYRRLLSTGGAAKILLNLWKESEYVSEAELAELGMRRSFGIEGVTQHGLAVGLAEIPAEVSALNAQVRSVSIAGAAFGLVKRDEQSVKRVCISGTALLHEYMIRLAEAHIEKLRSLRFYLDDRNDQ